MFVSVTSAPMATSGRFIVHQNSW